MQPVVRFLTENKKIAIRPGSSLLDAGNRAGVSIRTRCGGKAACLMCKVKVEDQSFLTKPEKSEQLKLGALLEEGWRLACQAKVTGNGDVEVLVPEDPLKSAVRALLAKQKEEDLW
ncbi:2Fe-2S iron-sulfur cluster-binding protein [Gorillibacterium massiliense]|uniref:2Fe-2S iron-sulfur cluster-binding protein n=1 Tax=Gorillibacterium massiliense TaxID=1280390 RepID=UPI00059269CE|nr:2Fe-2S iron-sulfur cluster-binding protein [Gorillibacterium massiliense]